MTTPGGCHRSRALADEYIRGVSDLLVLSFYQLLAILLTRLRMLGSLW